MDWGAIAVAITTGVVGIVGTALGAWLAGRSQTANLRISIDAEERRAKNAEKRRIYAAHLAACTEVQRAVLKRDGSQAEEKRAATLEYGIAAAASVAIAAEVSLIAPQNVSDLALSAAKEAGNFKSGAVNKYFGIREQLITAMRDDLSGNQAGNGESVSIHGSLD